MRTVGGDGPYKGRSDKLRFTASWGACVGLPMGKRLVFIYKIGNFANKMGELLLTFCFYHI